ncbi:MAG: membrane protein insertion efficiency factor YidD [Synergistaceae bacterium]|nr:membrane protein insertion efficiency factor YidD [Synergistaceae bacterium]
MSLPSIPSKIAVGLIRVYQICVSPLLGANCRFSPTCSHYAMEAFERHGFLGGLFLTVCRVVRCGPWHPGGFDPVPLEFKFGKMLRRR